MELDRLLQIIRALNKEKVQYVVVGGIAVNLHGIPRYTEDLDLMIRATPGNIANVQKALKSVYADPSIDELTPDEFSIYSVIRYGTPDDFYIDLMTKLGEFATYDSIGSETLEIEGTAVRIATLEALYWMKSDTVRLKDKADARLLLKLMQMIKEGEASDRDSPP